MVRKITAEKEWKVKTSETKPAKESTKQQKLERVSVKHLQAKKKKM